MVTKNFVQVAAVCLVFGFSITGCELIGPDRESTLSKNLQKWEKAETQNYSFTYTHGCFCILVGDFTVVVRAGVIASVTDQSDGVEVDGEQLNQFRTISQLFELLEEAYSSGADKIEIEYGTYGEPSSVSIDYIEEAIDDELFFGVRDVSVGE